MKLITILLVLAGLFGSLAEAAGQRWANRLNAAEGEALLWLEAELAPLEAPGESAGESAGESSGGEPVGEAEVAEAAADGGASPAAGEAGTPDSPAAAEEGAVAQPALPPADGEASPAGETLEEAAEESPPEPPKDRFAALVLPFLTPQPQGGVILLHDRGGHPDWPGVIAPLRCIRIPPGPGVRTIAKVPLRKGEVDQDFDQEELAELLDQEPFNVAVADLYKTRFSKVPGVLYTAGVQHAKNVAKALQSEGTAAAVAQRPIAGEDSAAESDETAVAEDGSTIAVE